MLNHILNAVSAAGNVLDLPGSSLRDLAAGQNPFDQYLTPFSDQNRFTGRDVLRHHGLIGNENTWGNFGLGLATEMALDPVNLVTGVTAARRLLGTSRANKAARIWNSRAATNNLAVDRLNATADDAARFAREQAVYHRKPLPADNVVDLHVLPPGLAKHAGTVHEANALKLAYGSRDDAAQAFGKMYGIENVQPSQARMANTLAKGGEFTAYQYSPSGALIDARGAVHAQRPDLVFHADDMRRKGEVYRHSGGADEDMLHLPRLLDTMAHESIHSMRQKRPTLYDAVQSGVGHVGEQQMGFDRMRDAAKQAEELAKLGSSHTEENLANGLGKAIGRGLNRHQMPLVDAVTRNHPQEQLIQRLADIISETYPGVGSSHGGNPKQVAAAMIDYVTGKAKNATAITKSGTRKSSRYAPRSFAPLKQAKLSRGIHQPLVPVTPVFGKKDARDAAELALFNAMSRGSHSQ